MTINSTGVLLAFSTIAKLIRLAATTTTAVRQPLQINHEGITS
jgi:hypothetical protein